MLGVTVFMSRDHLLAAFYFARECHAIEIRGAEGPITDKHRAYVIGSILSAVAFLEAQINEVFIEPRLFAFTPELQAKLEKLWDYGMESASVLTKYQGALLLRGGPEFDKGQQLFQDVDLVVKLRNALVHYKPEWQALNQTHRMEKLLNGRFPLNPLTDSEEVFFPSRCLGYGCARWAVRSVLAFGHEFFTRLGLPKYFGDYLKDPEFNLP